MKRYFSLRFFIWLIVIAISSAVITFIITDGWNYQELYLPSEKFSYISINPDSTWILIMMSLLISFTLIDFFRNASINYRVLQNSRLIALISIIVVVAISSIYFASLFSTMAEYLPVLDPSQRSIFIRYGIDNLILSLILLFTGIVVYFLTNQKILNGKTSPPVA